MFNEKAPGARGERGGAFSHPAQIAGGESVYPVKVWTDEVARLKEAINPNNPPIDCSNKNATIMRRFNTGELPCQSQLPTNHYRQCGLDRMQNCWS